MPFGASVGNQVLKQTKKFYATAASFAEVYLAMCTKKPIALAGESIFRWLLLSNIEQYTQSMLSSLILVVFIVNDV